MFQALHVPKASTLRNGALCKKQSNRGLLRRALLKATTWVKEATKQIDSQPKVIKTLCSPGLSTL